MRARSLAATITAAALLAIGVSVGGPAPTARAATIEDQVQDVVDEMFCVQPYAESACYNGAAQTITAGASGELIAVSLVLDRQAFTTHDLALQLRAGGPSGALLTTSEPVGAGDIPVAPGADWVTFLFPEPYVVGEGEVLALVLPDMDMSETADPRWGVGKADADVYPGGVAFGGVMGTSWQQYEDGSDFAFATYIASGPPTCDLALASPGGDPVDELTAAVGDEVELIGADFGALAAITIEFDPPDGDPFQDGTVADLFGDFGGTLVLEATDIGSWQISAWPDELIECADAVTLSVEEAAVATPTGSVLGAVGTPRLTPPATSTDPTRTAADTEGGLAIVLASMAALAVGTLLLARRSPGRE